MQVKKKKIKLLVWVMSRSHGEGNWDRSSPLVLVLSLWENYQRQEIYSAGQKWGAKFNQNKQTKPTTPNTTHLHDWWWRTAQNLQQIVHRIVGCLWMSPLDHNSGGNEISCSTNPGQPDSRVPNVGLYLTAPSPHFYLTLNKDSPGDLQNHLSKVKAKI